MATKLKVAEKVKINYCGPRELAMLPGIGRTLAETILDLRDAKGDLTLDDLVHVKHLHVTPQLIDKLDFRPFEENEEEDGYLGSGANDMAARVDQAIQNSKLKGPPAQYLTQPPTGAEQLPSSYGAYPGSMGQLGSGQPGQMGQAGMSPMGYSSFMGQPSPSKMGQSSQLYQPYPSWAGGQTNFQSGNIMQAWPPMGLYNANTVGMPQYPPMGSFDPSKLSSQPIGQTDLACARSPPAPNTPANVKSEVDWPGDNAASSGKDKGDFSSSSKQMKSDWLPKSLYFDPNKTTWEAFYLKFQNFAKEKNWSSVEAKSKLMYVLEGRAAEFFASLHEREPDLPFYDVVRRMETRFAFRELQETSQLAFMNCTQNKDEKNEEWADRVLTLATRAFKSLPDDHIQKQAILRFCHGCYDKEAGMHAANKMPTRMEEAIGCVKWYQYNHQIFVTKKKVSMVGEGMSYDFPDSHVWAASLQDKPVANQGRDNTRGRPRERYVRYSGQDSSPNDTANESKESSSKSDKTLEDRMVSLEDMFRQVLKKLDSAPERKPVSNRSPSPARSRTESPSRCFHCNMEGHFKRDCPNKRVSFKQVQQLGTEDLNRNGSDH